MSLFNGLISGNRYVFYEKKPNCAENIKLSANFIDIIGDTLRLSEYCYDDNIIHYHMITMPIGWIIKIDNSYIVSHESIKINF